MYKLNHDFNVSVCNVILSALQEDITEEMYVLSSLKRIAEISSSKCNLRINYNIVREYITLLVKLERIKTWRSEQGLAQSARMLIKVIDTREVSGREFEFAVSTNEQRIKSLEEELAMYVQKFGKIDPKE